MLEMLSSPVVSSSPSLNSYSSRLAEIAARVVEEVRAESDYDYGFCDVEDDENLSEETQQKQQHVKEREDGDNEEGEEEDDKEFEFAFVARQFEFSPIPADEIFYNGQILPVYPLFNTDLLRDYELENSSSNVNSKPPTAGKSTARLPLRKLFIEEGEGASSCSSSEADDLEGVASGTYCVWTPGGARASAEAGDSSSGLCKKSNSTGTSKRWRFRDLLSRSSSEGGEAFVFLTPKSARKREDKPEKHDKVIAELPPVSGRAKTKGATVCDGPTTTTCNYGKNNGNDRRRSYLPYRKDLVGFFANMNGVSRNLQPF